jgi:hypothetical protein
MKLNYQKIVRQIIIREAMKDHNLSAKSVESQIKLSHEIPFQKDKLDKSFAQNHRTISIKQQILQKHKSCCNMEFPMPSDLFHK